MREARVRPAWTGVASCSNLQADAADHATASLICRSSPAPAPPTRVSGFIALDRPGRTAHHHAPPLRPVRLPGRSTKSQIGSIVQDPVRPPEARRRRHRPRGDHRRPRREARDAHERPRRLAPARPRGSRAVDGRGVLLDAGPRARARHAAARQGEDVPVGRADRRRRKADGEAARAARAAPRPDEQRPARAAATRGARAGDDHAARRAAGPADEPGARPRGRAHGGADRRAARRSKRRPARRGCCTA